MIDLTKTDNPGNFQCSPGHQAFSRFYCKIIPVTDFQWCEFLQASGASVGRVGIISGVPLSPLLCLASPLLRFFFIRDLAMCQFSTQGAQGYVPNLINFASDHEGYVPIWHTSLQGYVPNENLMCQILCAWLPVQTCTSGSSGRS